MTEATDDDQMILRLLNRQRIDVRAQLALLLKYGEIDAETYDRLVQRIVGAYDELTERLTGPHAP